MVDCAGSDSKGSANGQGNEGFRQVILLGGSRAIHVRGLQQISSCAILVAERRCDGAFPKGAGDHQLPQLSTDIRGAIHVEAGATLQLSNVLVTGTSPAPIITLAKGGTLVCVDSVLGPNIWIEGETPETQQPQSGKQVPQRQGPWCCRASGTLIATRCSFIGGTGGCLSLMEGASAELTHCNLAGSLRGKGAELHGQGTALVATCCLFRDNYLAGCAVLGGASARFHRCRFERAVESGGLAVHDVGSCVAAEVCIFAGNSRSGVFVSAGGKLELTGCNVSDNRRYAGMEVKGQGSSARCHGCGFHGNVRAEIYVLAGAMLELSGGTIARGEEAEYSVWGTDAGTEVQMDGVTLENARLVFAGANVRIA